MPTEYGLDVAVKLEPESRLKNLYNWSIQEFDNEGKQVGPDYIPFGYGTNFYAAELRLADSMSIDTKAQLRGEIEKTVVARRRYIRAELRTGYPQQDAWSAPSLSYFGKKAKIEDITLIIRPAEGDEAEACGLGGGLAFAGSDGERYGDSLEVQFVVAPARFDDLVKRIRERSVDIVNLRLSRVAGLFSEWSPDIDVRHLKLLTNPESHRLDLAGAGSIEPQTMGIVKEAVLTLHSMQTFHAHEHEGEKDEPISNNGVAVSAAPLPSAPQVDTREIAERLKQIGWMLMGILVILLAMLFR